MHEIRSAIVHGERRDPLASKTAAKKKADSGASLAGIRIPREETRRCDQRREGRHLNLVEAATVTWQRRVHEVSVLNVSSKGAMIQSDLLPRIGARIDIRFGGCERTRCFVRWVRDGRIGLEFDKETLVIAPRDVRELIVGGRRAGEQPTISVVKQRAPRQSLILNGELHWPRGTMPVRLRNISARGAMLEAQRDLKPGTEVVLDFGGIAASGRVCWCRGHQIGIHFGDAFDVAALAQPEPASESFDLVKPEYLKSELDPNSPWAARWERLMAEDL